MTNKITLNARIDSIAYETLTREDFDFLVERARKSVHKTVKSDKPTKAQIAHQNDIAKVQEYVAQVGTVTCADIQNEFGFSNQKAARVLNDANLVKTPAKGKEKATWAVA